MPQTVWLMAAIVTVGAPEVAAVTVNAAAPDTFGSADFAMIDAVPADTPVTVPSVPTVATAVLLELHVTVRLGAAGPASTDAANWNFAPTAIVALDGDTVTLWIAASGGVVVTGGTVTLSPQPTSAAAA